MYLLLLFFALANCKVNILIIPATQDANASVHVTGCNTALMSEVELQSFNLTPKKIFCKLSKWKSRPDDVYVRGISRYGYRDLTVTVTSPKWWITSIHKQTVTVHTQDFINNSTIPVTYKADIYAEVMESMTVTWAVRSPVSVADDITINFADRISHASAWDREETVVRTRNMSSTDIELTLQPDERVTAVIEATQIVMDVSVDINAYADGDLYFVNTLFSYPLFGRAMDVVEYFKYAGEDDHIRGNMKIRVLYYVDDDVTVRENPNTTGLDEEPPRMETTTIYSY